MSKDTFVVVSVSDRVRDLNVLLATIKARPKFKDIDVCLWFQDPENVQSQIAHRERYAKIFVVPKKQGCHTARVELLRHIRYDKYINLDDDIEMTDQTDYAPALAKVEEKGTGFVLTNWARTRRLMEAKIPRMRPVFVKQIMVYQGGGMVYRDEIAELMRGLPTDMQRFDHSWPLTSYINGYTNYRYLGSLSVHRICRVGGMNQFIKETKVNLSMQDYVTFRTGKTGWPDYLIPMDEDVKPKAHEAHRANYKGNGKFRHASV